MPRRWTFAALALALAVTPFAFAAFADEDEDEDEDDEDEHEDEREREDRGERAPARAPAVTAPGTGAAPIDPMYAAECGSCHFAYPPGLLPARSWSTLLRDLPRHFGDDATVAEPARTQLETWLVAHAAPSRPGGPAPLRITEASGWLREHDEIPAAWAKDPAIRSFANCPACHTGASRGSFREGEVVVPGHRGWDD